MTDTTSTTSEHFQKPDTIDSPPIYNKPNAYDEQEIVYDRPHEKDEQPSESGEAIETVVQLAVGHNKRPVSPIQDNEPGQGKETIPKADDNVVHNSKNDSATSILSSNSDASSDSSSSRDSTSSDVFVTTKKGSNNNMLMYELRKHALGKPHMHDIYPYGSKTVAFRKVQPHSYSWGFQNILYRAAADGKESNAEEDAKLAETRRRAFQKDIIIECGTEQQELVNKTKSHLMFSYETIYQGFWLRWRRPSLLSHDMTCEVAPYEGPLPAEGQPRRRRNWKLLAEFDSHRMGYLIHLGRLAIDQTAVALFEDPELIEAHLLISCCTLVDLMREVVEKAVGLGEGGVAGSS
ncbi:hypothetical protein BDB00DRAFT_772080 [Zychaea mexicana]|uniref:uncharacterized protein n=1 Tax=Zychaea mexicana TaxID=64656 RepID=UPI0022FE3FA4|nr:uncharacterized protein BDB00DRAFT_772080 [Zychaea mexicana]KAI9488642.1 hypothetical protein BDB00DRAFT_772080 [Zychaea mexicana]